MQEVVSRYKDNPTILAWQLVNEGKADDDSSGTCSSETTAFNDLYSFTTDMIGVIKAIDTKHLISHGLLYNNCGIHSGTTHYADISNIAGNDLYELHDYAGAGSTMSPDATYLFAQAQAASKPVIVGETGIDRSVGLATRAADFDAKFQAWQAYPQVAGITPWVWNGSGVGGSVDSIFDITTNDPVLGVIARHGMAPPP